jgi:hypothetical protein
VVVGRRRRRGGGGGRTERGVKSWLSGSSRALKRSGGLGWLAILPTGQPNSICLADYPELKTAENTDPAARGSAPVAVAVAVAVAVDGQHRTVCGLRSAVRGVQPSSQAVANRRFY